VLIHSLYTTNPRTRSLRPIRVSSDQNTRWWLSFLFSTYKRQEFLVPPYLPDRYRFESRFFLSRWRTRVTLAMARGGGIASNDRERETKKEGGYCSPLFSCFLVLLLYSNLPFSTLLCFQLLWFSNRCSLIFFPTVKMSFGSLCFFFLNLPPVFHLFFFVFVFHSFLSSFPIFPSPARLSPLVFIKRKGGLLPVSSHGTGVGGWPGGHLAASPGPPAGLVPSIFLFGGRWGAWVLSGFGQVGRKRESGKNTGEQNFSFPCLCVGRERRRIMLFKTTLFQVLFFWNNPKMGYDNIYSIQNKFVFKYKNIFL